MSKNHVWLIEERTAIGWRPRQFSLQFDRKGARVWARMWRREGHDVRVVKYVKGAK